MMQMQTFLRPGGPARIAAHRGWSAVAPENTLAAFRGALRLGVEMLECDVQPAAGGQPVVIHDDDLDRTTDGRGPVSSMPLEALRRLDAGAWFGHDFAGERIPTLDETLDLAGGRCLVNIEIKASAVRRAGDRVVDGVLETVARRGMESGVLLSSFAPEALERVRRSGSPVHTASLLDRHRHRGMTPVEVMDAVGSVALHCSVREADREVVRACHAAGRPVGVYTANSRRQLARLLELGVDVVFTDRPDRALAMRDERGGPASRPPERGR